MIDSNNNFLSNINQSLPISKDSNHTIKSNYHRITNYRLISVVIFIIAIILSVNHTQAAIIHDQNTVDSDSNVDGIANIGNDGSTSFSDSIIKDDSYQSIIEGNGSSAVSGNDVINDVDSNNSDIDSSPDFGAEINFNNSKGSTLDSNYLTLQEEQIINPDLSLYPNYVGVHTLSNWDDDDSLAFIDMTTEASNGINDTAFARVSKSPSHMVKMSWDSGFSKLEVGDTISIYVTFIRNVPNDGYLLAYTGASTVTTSNTIKHDYSSSAGIPGWIDFTLTSGFISELIEEGTDGFSIRYLTTTNEGTELIDSTEISEIYGTLSQGAYYNGEFEYQWNTLDFDEENSEIAIFVGNHTGTENLDLEYYMGSSWISLGNITATGWTNITVLDLSSSNYTIRLSGATLIGDSNLDSWDIDIIILHSWSIEVTDYELQWEHQSLSVNTFGEFIELAIYGYSTDTENFEIQTWDLNTSSWNIPLTVQIGSVLQWYNQSIDSNAIGDGSSITWRYRGTLEESDNSLSTLYIDYAGISSFSIPPIISSPNDIEYFEGNTSNSIEWDVSDLNPSSFIIYRDNIQLFSSPWTSGTINLNVDSLTAGLYNYTIIVKDSYNTSSYDTVFVNVTDATPPDINSHSDVIYSEGNSGNVISWIGDDFHPDTYFVLKNGSLYESGTWGSSSPITVDIDGLGIGYYNFTIILSDSSGNQISDMVIVRVISESVLTNSPVDINYIFGDTGNSLIWVSSDANPDKYVIYKNGSIVDSGSWSSESAIIYNVDGLEIGIYNYTIILNDTSSNELLDQVYVIVSDMPIWDFVQNDIIFDEGTPNHYLQWNSTDLLPDTYEIYKNGTLYDSNSWNNSTVISLNVTDLLKGTYNFTIFVYDTIGNTITNSTIVIVNDVTIPFVQNPPGNIDNYIEGTTGYTINWNAADLHETSYVIYNDSNNVILETGVWTSNNNISINIDGLTIGIYNFTIVFYDSSNNPSNPSSVIVTVNDLTDPVLIEKPDNLEISDQSTGNNLQWIATDTNPLNFTLYQNSTDILSGTWNSTIPILYNIDHLIKGYYIFTILIGDTSNNSILFTFNVIITTDEIMPFIVSSPNELLIIESGSIGNQLSWNVTDENADLYEIYNSTSLLFSSTWENDTLIHYTIDGLQLGFHNITILFFDQTGNYVLNTTWINIIDTTLPVFISQPSNLSYVEGDTGNFLEWSIFDLNPSTYQIFRNNQSILLGVYSNESINLDINGLTKGNYTFTIVVFDLSGNNITQFIVLTVYDLTSPIIIFSPSDIKYAEGTTGNSFSWTAIDNYPSNYIVLNDGNQWITDNWIANNIVTISIDNLVKGVYNFTVIIYDASANQVIVQLNIRVIDTTIPTIDSFPGNQTIIESTLNNIVQWNITDLYPSNYSILIDEVELFSNNWNVGIPVTIILDSLEAGTYNFTIIFSDLSNNTIINTIFVFVIDKTIPEFIETPENETTIDDGTLNNNLIWKVTDLHPSTYVILVNGQPLDSQIWSDTQPIKINIDNLRPDYYNYTIVVYDESNNVNTHTVILRVKNPNIIDTIKPIIVYTSSVYESDIEVISVIWSTVDAEFVENGDVSLLFLNNADEVILRVKASIINGSYLFVLNYTNIKVGSYTWLISFTSEGYLPWEGLELQVNVLPYSYMLDIQFNNEIKSGEEFTITTIVYLTNNNNGTSLSLNELFSKAKEGQSVPAVGVKVQFVIQLLYSDGSEIRITKSSITNSIGLAIVFLSSEETNSLVSINNIEISINQNDYGNGISEFIDQIDLPELVESNPSIYQLIVVMALNNINVVYAVVTLIIIGIYWIISVRRRQKDYVAKLNVEIQIAQSELGGLLAIQAIVIQNTSKLNLYEEEIGELDLSSTLIGGMVSAFSTFLSEVGKQELFGFEIMEREGISITSHHGKISNIIIISKGKIPFVILDQITEAQRLIEKRFKNYFKTDGRGVLHLQKEQVRPLFAQAEFKISMIEDYYFQKNNIRNLVKEKSISTSMKRNIKSLMDYSGNDLQGLSFKSVDKYFKDRGMTAKMRARAIILAYKYKILIPRIEYDQKEDSSNFKNSGSD